MASKILTILLSATVAVCHCSTIKPLFTRNHHPSGEPQLRIYDGSKTSIKDHPSIGGLLVRGTYHCQVTIVSNSWVVTTMECVKSNPISDFTILVGSQNGVKGQKFAVDNIVKHPKYGISPYDYEFACIKINGTFSWSDKVKAINLPKTQPQANTTMIVAGWGATAPDEDSKTPLLQGNMFWLAKDSCKETYDPFGFTWTDRLACAYNEGKTTLCTDDWANAFVANETFYGMFIGGINVGWCSSIAQPIMLSNISSVAAWIAKTTGAQYA